MTISSGTRLGPYEVIAPLGAGGMGEVWKARDTRLERSVAIKVLPAEFAENAQLKLRFEREAKTISQLNHPHICTLYDVGVFSVGRPPSAADGAEDRGAAPSVFNVGRPTSAGDAVGDRSATLSHDVPYLVMELLEGESLADKIAKGPLPLDQVLRYGIEIAEALEKAHKAGITHRDLKPGNIMITKSGAKLLDFGLAKPVTVFDANSATVHKPLTQEGSIVGTFQYMAPEQIEGGEVDARTDIFAFGALLYEMATAKRAFSGKSNASLIANILGAEPQPIAAIVPVAPERLDRVVHTCLQKEPDERWQSAHDVATELRWIAENPRDGVHRDTRDWLAWGIAAALLAVALGFAYLWNRVRSAPAPRMLTEIVPPPNTEFLFPLTIPVISPDGGMLAFNTRASDGKFHLWVRHLDTGIQEPIAETSGTLAVAWSPDSRSIAYESHNKLQRVSAAGGPPQILCGAGSGRGVTWLPDGTILFAPLDRSAIYRVSANGGTPVAVTKLEANEYSHRWPYALPDGKHFLYLAQIASGPERGRIYLGTLGSGERKQIAVANSAVAFARSGYVLYCREHSLVAQPFNARTLETTGEAVVVADPVETTSVTASAAFSVSNTGALVYQHGNSGSVSELTWTDRSGKELTKIGGQADYQRPLLSHDEKRLAVDILDIQGNSNIWIFDLTRQTQVRLTTEAGLQSHAIWSPDDQYVAFAARMTESGQTEIYRKAASGIGAPQLLFKSDAPLIALTEWSADGRYLIFHEARANTKTDLDVYMYSFAGGKITPLIQSPFNDMTARLSPDEHWLAYASNETGRSEVYVVPFPNPTSRVAVSTNGGSQPRWSRDGKELYYTSPDNKVMAVPVKTGATFEPGLPQALFSYRPKSGGWPFDVARDGRFVLNQPVHDALLTPFTVVTNWDKNLNGH